jgi:hypothetical protein
MKRLLIILSLLPINLFGQILVDDVGDGWKNKVDSAICLIQTVSPEASALLTRTTNRVEFWLGDRSSTRPDPNLGQGTILLAVDEIGLGIINIAAVLVHESLHLFLHQTQAGLQPDHEEATAYFWELIFLEKVPNCPTWLIINAETQLKAIGTGN